MSSSAIRNVNLLWEKKYRGAYPPSDFALDDSRSLTLAIPRPLEPRAYDLTVHAGDGGAEIRWGFSVETLMKLEVADSDDCIGMTSDDLYLFKNRVKSRFLSDKHINYIDCALSGDGQRLSAAFSDLAGASYALAYGDISCRLIWLREFDVPITCTAISRDGSRVLASDENGLLTMLDASRRDLWFFELNRPVTAIACSSDGTSAAYCAAGGAVGLIVNDGSRKWEVQIDGDLTTVALSGDGSLCAVLSTRPGDPTGVATIHLIGADGNNAWQHGTDRRTTGICLSPDGRHMAVGSRDGTISVYEVVLGDVADGGGTGSTESCRLQAKQLEDSGEYSLACGVLREALVAHPADTALCSAYLDLYTRWSDKTFALSVTQMEQGDSRSAIRGLAAVLNEDPMCLRAAELLRTAREARAQQLIVEAVQTEAGGDTEGAEQRLREAVAVAPMDISGPREQLGLLWERQSAALDSLAAELENKGDRRGAMDALLRAEVRSPSNDRAARLRKLQIDIEYSAGIEAYGAKRYSEALFQFKKVLGLDRSHPEALRHIEFARRFAQETSSESLADRFSRLE